MATARLVLIDLRDGRLRHLKLTNTAVCRFEERAGFKSIDSMLSAGVSTFLVQTLLWAGLLWQEPGLTWEQAGDLIDSYIDNGGESAIDLMAPLLEALGQASIFRNRRKPNGRDPDGIPKAQTEQSTPAPSTPTPTT
jgi:hypothetical protein